MAAIPSQNQIHTEE